MSRYRLKSELYGADLLLDVNIDLYPLELNERYTMLISQSLVTDQSQARDEYDPVRLPPLHTPAVIDGRMLSSCAMQHTQ